MPENAEANSSERRTHVLPPETRIGHVHLKVSDLARSEAFYAGILGFDVVQRVPGAVFMSAGGYHHHIAINTWESEGAPPAPRRAAGLYHTAILFPDRRSLAQAVKRLIEARYPIDGAADHGVSEAIYLRDPDGNGVELYRDRPRDEWPRDPDGGIAMFTRRLDLEALLALADDD